MSWKLFACVALGALLHGEALMAGGGGSYSTPTPVPVPVPVPVPTPPAQLYYYRDCNCYRLASFGGPEQERPEPCLQVRNRLLEFVRQSSGCNLNPQSMNVDGNRMASCVFSGSAHVQVVPIAYAATNLSISTPQEAKQQALDFLLHHFCPAQSSPPPSLTPGPAPEIMRAL